MSSGKEQDTLRFYAQHNVAVKEEQLMDRADLQPYRFVRLNPRFDSASTLAKLVAEVARDPYPLKVPWLDGFYALPSDFSVQKSECFQTARIYGQDVSSGAAVAALMTDRYDRCGSPKEVETTSLRVLDLCCCPGLKLCAIADMLSTSSSSSSQQHTLIGVDVSEQRMAVCKRIVHKYQISSSRSREESETSPDSSNVRIRLYCNDGTSFATIQPDQHNLVFDSVVASEEEASRSVNKRKRMNKSARARQRKRLDDVASLDVVESHVSCSSTCDTAETGSDDANRRTAPPRIHLFDRVLVDAECSTDGSLVHVQKRLAKQQQQQISCSTQWSTSNQQQMSELVELQKQLVATGYRMLKPGGTLVYSTCSLSFDQNEGVVGWLLGEFPDARLVPVNFLKDGAKKDSPPTEHSDLVQEGSISGTVRFLPNVISKNEQVATPDRGRLYGGGFFLAKILKSIDI